MKTCLWERFDRIVVFDTETTGIDFARDEIIELGAVSLEAGEERESMDCLIRLSPGRSGPAHRKRDQICPAEGDRGRCLHGPSF